jgi:hypothetical protein
MHSHCASHKYSLTLFLKSIGKWNREVSEPGGHLPEREIVTGIGPVAVRCPRVRDRAGEGSERIRFSSAILPPYTAVIASALLIRRRQEF